MYICAYMYVCMYACIMFDVHGVSILNRRGSRRLANQLQFGLRRSADAIACRRVAEDLNCGCSGEIFQICLCMYVCMYVCMYT